MPIITLMYTSVLSLVFLLLVACGGTKLGETLSIDSSQGPVLPPSPIPVQMVTETPLVSGTTPASPDLNQTPTVDGTSEPDASVTIFSDSACTAAVGTGTADAIGNFSITVNRQEGGTSNTYFAQATVSGKLTSSCSTSSASYFSTAIRPGLAWLTGTQTNAPANPTQLNQGTAYAIEWSSSEFDSAHFTHSTTVSPNELQINVAGDYWVSATLPQVMTVGNMRPVVRMEVRVNGALVPGAVGESSYIRNDGTTGNTESSSHVAMLLRGLNSNDRVEIFVQETAGHDGSEVVNISSVASLYVEYVNSDRKFFTASATRLVSGTNVNPGAPSALEWTEGREDTGFTHDDAASPENIVLSAGMHLLYINVPLNGSVTRGAPRLLVRLNGAVINGGQASQGYIRNDSGHNDSSLHWSGHFNANNGDVLTVTMQQEAGGGTINVQAGSPAQLSLERLDNNDNLIALRATALTSGNNWNPAVPSTLVWDNMDAHDTNIYTHSTLANQHQVTVNEQGDYLVTYNDAMTSTVQRANPIIKVQVNGTDVPGAETKTHYNRNNSGHNESSASLSYLLRNLSAGDVITLTAEQDVAGGTVDDIEDALLSIYKK